MLGVEVPKFELNVVQERSFGKFMANTVGSLGDKAHDRSPCSLMHINHDIIAVCKKSVIKPKLVQPGFFFKTKNRVNVRRMANHTQRKMFHQNR